MELFDNSTPAGRKTAEEYMEPVPVTISGVKLPEAARLLFLYVVIRGREGTSRCDFRADLVAAAEAHLNSCGECQEALRDSGLLPFASEASQAIVSAELHTGLVEAPEVRGATQSLLEGTNTLGGQRDRVIKGLESLEVQHEMASALKSHLEYLLETGGPR
jgi:hypothetical protein